MMKTFAKLVTWGLFCIHALIPFCLLFSNLFGFAFSLSGYTLFSVICVSFSVLTLVVVFLKTELFLGKMFSRLFGLSLPLCTVEWLFFLTKGDFPYVIACVLVAFVCVVAVNVKLVKSKNAKIIISLSSAASFLFVTFFSVLFMFMGSIGASTVLDTIQSPDGVYYADIIDVDQGAFGGNTVVEVSKKRKADILIFRFEEKGKQMYIGEWNEYDDMEIFWKQNDCLVINSEEYTVN